MIWKWQIYTKTNSCILIVFQNIPQILPISHCSLYHVQPILKIPPKSVHMFYCNVAKGKQTNVGDRTTFTVYGRKDTKLSIPAFCTYSQLFSCHFQRLSSIEGKKSIQVDQLLLVCCLSNTLYLFLNNAFNTLKPEENDYHCADILKTPFL